MTNEFYKPGEERAARVSALFATVARRYITEVLPRS